jgi:hypothetical protein
MINYIKFVNIPPVNFSNPLLSGNDLFHSYGKEVNEKPMIMPADKFFWGGCNRKLEAINLDLVLQITP